MNEEQNIWVIVSGTLATVLTALGVKEWFPSLLNYFQENKTAKRKEITKLQERLDKIEQELNEATNKLAQLGAMLPLMRQMVKDNPENIDLLLDQMEKTIFHPEDVEQ